jgi:formylglycine-generating enzyme required for sulfatase activity
LPTEQELEVFLRNSQTKSNTDNVGFLHPNDASNVNGEVWCWTRSQYSPYPRFQAFDGLLNEYNAKFMCNQFVLRGGCIVTPENHYRHSYRNFYLAQQRWMFSGIRLAKDII